MRFQTLIKSKFAEILSYLPQTDQPQVTYIMPRQQSPNLLINTAYMAERKETYRVKMEAVFAYAEHNQCRSQVLLAYFDEHHPQKCGTCDVCLAEKRKNKAGETAEHLNDEIIRLLSAAPLTIDQLIPAIKYGQDKDRIEALRLLLDAGKIKTDGKRYYLG